MSSHDAFLSCVSDEFHKDSGRGGFVSYRGELADRLRNAGIHVEVQENFTGHGSDLLQKLEDYIKDCRFVIHLVGDMTGALAKADEVHAFLRSTPGFLASRPGLRTALGDCSGLSYTQWEALLALHHDRPLLRYQPIDAAPRSPSYVKDSAKQALQQAHGDRLKESGIFPELFKNQADLCLQVFTALYRGHLLDPATPHLAHRIQNLPYPSLGTLFKGREAFMRDLRAALTGGAKKAAAIVQNQKAAAIHALGGIGKTRAAVEYAWQHEQDYDALLFVSAPTPADLEKNLAALTGPLVLNLPEKDATEQQAQVNAALTWLHDHPRWFLILDNVDTPEALAAVTHLLAPLSGGHVCITSRLSNWPGSVQPLDLHVLSDDAGAEFLLERTQGKRSATKDDQALARDLSRRLDGLALALEQAGAYIGKLHLGFREYLQQLDVSEQKLLGWKDAALMDYPESVASTWLTTFEKLTPPERDLLNVLAWFDAEPIPLWLVASLGRKTALENQPPLGLREIIAGLAGWHFVIFNEDGQSIRLHRLVQEVTLLHIANEEMRRECLAHALLGLGQFAMDDLSDVRSWDRWEQVYPHALLLAEHAESERFWIAAVLVRNQVAGLLKNKAIYNHAEAILRESLRLAEQYLPKEHYGTLAASNNLAALLADTNRHAEAEIIFRRSLAFVEENFGPEEEIVAINLNNLAMVLRTTNHNIEAEFLQLRALDIYEKKHGSQHPGVALTLVNLAGTLSDTGRYADAEIMLRRALAIDEKVFGEAHPRVSVVLNNLGGILRETNRNEEAESMYRRSLAVDEKCYGPNHPMVATRLGNLAVLLANVGRNEEAEPMQLRALMIDGNAYGPDHPNVAIRLSNLASLMRSASRYMEAEPMYLRALSIDEASYGKMHPNVASDLNNLASILGEMNRWAEAEPMQRRALSIDELSYGPEHVNVARDLTNLASVLHETGRSKEALPLITRAVGILERHGEQQRYVHAHLATAQHWLSAIQRSSE